MNDYISDRVLNVADYVIDRKATVRQAAKQFGVSKSTVHKDLTERLCDPTRLEAVRAVMKENFDTKHIRGGISTKKKYETI